MHIFLRHIRSTHVPEVGVEPTRRKARDFESRTSTSSVTPAWIYYITNFYHVPNMVRGHHPGMFTSIYFILSRAIICNVFLPLPCKLQLWWTKSTTNIWSSNLLSLPCTPRGTGSLRPAFIILPILPCSWHGTSRHPFIVCQFLPRFSGPPLRHEEYERIQLYVFSHLRVRNIIHIVQYLPL